MVQYAVGENEEHRVDHPPLFACREHKTFLRLAPRFVEELLTAGQDIMPGNPDEIAQAFLKEAEPAYRLPEFLIPPKVILFNPRGLRGAEALPYTIVLVDKKFFGIPAKYLTMDRFEGCDDCAEQRGQRRTTPVMQVQRGQIPGATPVPGGGSGVRKLPPGAAPGGPPRGGPPKGAAPKGPPRPGPRP